jgi:hypothetical protein
VSNLALFGGDHMTCRFGPLYIWAERGLIHIEDARDNSYDSMSVRTALQRMVAISDMLRNSKAQMIADGAMYAEEYERQMRMLEQMTEVCRLAQEQGMPSDSSARNDLIRRRPVTVTVPTLKMAM